MPKKKSDAQKLAEDKLSEFLEEPVTLDEPKNKVEEKAEEIKEEPKEETKDKEVEFDFDKFADAAAEKAAAKVSEKIESIKKDETLTEKEKSEAIKKQEELTPVYIREGRNPKDYQEINDEALRIAELRMEAKLAERESKVEADKKAKEEEAKTIEEVKQARQKEYDDYVDMQLEDLMKSGKLPRPVDPKNENDVGMKARKVLFTTMLEVNQDRAKQGLPLINSVKEIFYEHYKPVDEQPAGVDAPIAGSTPVQSPSSDNEYSYNDIHKGSFFDFFKRK